MCKFLTTNTALKNSDYGNSYKGSCVRKNLAFTKASGFSVISIFFVSLLFSHVFMPFSAKATQSSHHTPQSIFKNDVTPALENLFPGQIEKWRRVYSAAERTGEWMQQQGLPLGGVALTVGVDASFFVGGNGGYDLLILPGPGDYLIVSKFSFVGPQLGAGGSLASGLTVNYVANVKSAFEYAGWFLGISGRLTPSIGVNGSLQFGVSSSDANKVLSLAYSWISGGITDFLTTALDQMRQARVTNIGFGGGVGASAKVSATLTYYTLEWSRVVPGAELPHVLSDYFYEIGFGG